MAPTELPAEQASTEQPPAKQRPTESVIKRAPQEDYMPKIPYADPDRWQRQLRRWAAAWVVHDAHPKFYDGYYKYYEEKEPYSDAFGKRDIGAGIMRHGMEHPILVHGDDMKMEKRAIEEKEVQLSVYMGGHCGPQGTWRDACPEDYFQGLDRSGSGTDAVIAVSALGVASTVGLLAALGTVLVCGYKRWGRRKTSSGDKV
ncbi:hypothetical protein SLS58_000402 [Diplodia intermedia]|uniref:Uncharacterized protein n=1 Tax=Diplodia intermedia TaxID=856260 RepID=A0ABR3U6P8_9PEZI